MVTPQLRIILTDLRENEGAISYMYGRLFGLRPDLKERYYSRISSSKMFDKVIDLLEGAETDSEINRVRELHLKLEVTSKELQLYTTMFIDTVITFCNKYLTKDILRELYSICSKIIKRIT